MYLSYQKFESKSYRKMDFSSFHYYGDYLMLITIEPFKERKKERKHGYISFSCWESPGMHFTHQAFLSQQNVFTNEHALSCKSGHSAEVCGPKTKGFIAKSFTKNDRRGDFHFKTRRLWNEDMQLYGCSVVYFGRVIFVNFKFRLLLSALYNQRDCPPFTLFTYVYFIPSGRELNSDVYWIQ